jgi:hypothetical protein
MRSRDIARKYVNMIVWFKTGEARAKTYRSGDTLSKCCISADLRLDEPNASLRFRLNIEHPVWQRYQIIMDANLFCFCQDTLWWDWLNFSWLCNTHLEIPSDCCVVTGYEHFIFDKKSSIHILWFFICRISSEKMLGCDSGDWDFCEHIHHFGSKQFEDREDYRTSLCKRSKWLYSEKALYSLISSTCFDMRWFSIKDHIHGNGDITNVWKHTFEGDS